MNNKIVFLLFLLSYLQCFAVEGLLIKTADQSFQDRWEKTSGKSVPRIADLPRVFKGQSFYVGVAVQKFSSNKEELSHLTFDLKIYNPAGKLFYKKENLTVLKRQISQKEFVQLSDDFVYFAFQFIDTFGKYRIDMEVLDQISKERKKLTSEIELIPLPNYKTIGLSEKETFAEWMSNYYHHQEPEKALPYFIYFTKSDLSDKEDIVLPVLSFFREIFLNNSYLFTQFSEAYTAENDKTKMLLTVLMYNSVDHEAFRKYFKNKKIEDLMQESAYPDIYGEVETPIYLDMLWSEFYASGKQKPILKLIQTLDYAKFQGSIEAYKTSEKGSKDMVHATKEATYKALVWSLKRHLANDELVVNYANWIFANAELNDLQKKELGILLTKYR